MFIHPEFPDDRRGDPKRQAELHVYEQLAHSRLPGVVLYEARAARNAPEVDFGIWIQDRARIALEVKGGWYARRQGRLHLRVDAGLEPTPCPLIQARDAAFSIRDAVKEAMNRKVYIIPVLLFPDMEPDPDIEEWAAHEVTRILWGSHDLVNRLLQVAAEIGVKYPPTGERIRQEVAVVSPGLCLPDDLEMAPEAVPEAAPAAVEMAAAVEPATATATLEVGEGRVVIHAGTVHLHITIVAPPNGGDDDGDGPPTVPDR